MKTITINENAVLAFALHEVLENYKEDSVDIPHTFINESFISRLLRNPSGLCPVSFVDNDFVVENINNMWSDLNENNFTDWEKFIEDVKYQLFDFEEIVRGTPEEAVHKNVVYTNAGKVLEIAFRCRSGENISPLVILNERPSEEYYDLGLSQYETYLADRTRYNDREDDSADFFDNIEYFEEGYVDTLNGGFDFGFDFNYVIYTGKEVTICNLDDNENCINRLIIKTGEIVEIAIADSCVVVKDEITYNNRKYHITINNGVKFVVVTSFME